MAALAALMNGGCASPPLSTRPAAASTSEASTLPCHFQRTPRTDKTPVASLQLLSATLVLGSNRDCLYLSEDQGRSFRELGCVPLVAGVKEPLGRVRFLNRMLGWVISDDTLLRTQDGGKRWEAFSFPGFVIRDVSFADATTGIWVGEKLLSGQTPDVLPAAFMTRDGGQHWSEVKSLPPVNADRARLEGVWMRSDSEVWTVGEEMLTSSDAGRTWSRMNIPEDVVLQLRNGSIQFNRGGVGWIHRLPNENYLLSCDSGLHWLERPTLGPSFKVIPLDCEHAYALNAGQIHASDNGGRDFHRVLDPEADTSGYGTLAWSQELGLLMALSEDTVATCQLGAGK